jgi:hypothetical protein
MSAQMRHETFTEQVPGLPLVTAASPARSPHWVEGRQDQDEEEKEGRA